MSRATLELTAPEPVEAVNGHRQMPVHPTPNLGTKMLQINKLVSASYNPPGRINTRALKRLVESIDANGLYYPILVSKNGFRIIDGHRRVAACKQLGWTHIPVRMVDEDQEATYATVNDTALKISSNDALFVYLREPRALSPRMKSFIVSAEKVIGRKLLKEICDRGLSVEVFRRATSLMVYCGHQTKEDLIRCVRWLLDCGMNFKARALIDHGAPPKHIMKAIKENKPLMLSFAEKKW